jgi:deoxyribodipyrimidine photolyase
MKIGIHFFRKDLRVDDNLALNELIKRVDRVVGLFVFDKKQIKKILSMRIIILVMQNVIVASVSR